MVKRALISVSNKEGVVEFARGLAGLGAEIISTGGTARLLAEAGIPVKPVAEVTGFPELLDGRVKTLQPAIHGGILAMRDKAEHMQQLAQHGITPIDLVAVNLYPFKETISKPGVTLEDAIENIDIGGPTMVRSAAKNYRHVIIVVNPARYPEILAALRDRGELSEEQRYALAVEAFRHTAQYDALISNYLGERIGQGILGFPADLTLTFVKAQDLRYGENPHQKAAFYRELFPCGPCISSARQLHGKELSYNNINDADAALELVKEFDEPAAVAVKHANPCGVGVADSLVEAYRKAFEADPVSIFGGIVALNRVVDADTAAEIARIFVEIVIAPGYEQRALSILQSKKDLRILETGDEPRRGVAYDLKKVVGGLLVQEADVIGVDTSQWRVMTRREPTPEEMRDLVFGWKVVKYVKSNAIVLARDLQTVGIGPGQPNRIDSTRIAIRHAGDKARGSVLASDAFFPFPDVVEAAAEAGVTAMVQPGGSLRDEESIRLADEKGMTLIFTGRRHFRH